MIAQLKITAIVLVFACVSAMPASLEAQEHLALSKGQTVYVPAYSHIYTGGKKRPFALAITLSIRNIDLDTDITLSEVSYYGSKGKLIESFVEDAPSIKPQESVRFVIAEGDEGGGSGANFIVKWKAATEVDHDWRPIQPGHILHFSRQSHYLQLTPLRF